MTTPASTPANAAWGDGLGTFTTDGELLDVWFPSPTLGTLPAGRDRALAPRSLADQASEDAVRGVELRPVLVESDLDAPVTSVGDAYLRLHLLSHRLVAPNEQNLEALFGALPNNAWTDRGPIPADSVSERLPQLRRAGVQVYAVDKFPRLLDYVVPERVRIADAGRVRLGAYLSPGTVVMHEGFVNFNAGTLGASMVEGRISQGVVVGAGSDIGGGASIMGTLSGGGTQRVRIGERSLLGANSGIGISLGDDCIVEAGLYVTAGTKVRLPKTEGAPVVKAVELSGVNNLLFRRDSITGAVEALSRTGRGIELNPDLH